MGYLYQTSAIADSESPLNPGDGIVMKIVAVVGDTGRDWAAYWGWANMSDERIKDYGAKLPQETAEELFPYFNERGLTYRR